MKKRLPVCLAVLSVLLSWSLVAQSQTAQKQAPSPAATETQDENLKEYVELLRSDVRSQKAEVMGSMMALNIDESAKFWPIYSEYDKELTKLNDQRVANIQEYARNYDSMTDAQADELVQRAMEYRKERAELLAKYYGRMKDALGAVQAARFLQVEDQLLMIIDLQIASSLPVVGQGS
ncbi:MAG TPA: hypothetical protein VMD98_09125 [Bryocella sp.]|nr:hypothetical protein [Bryocella sp.]